MLETKKRRAKLRKDPENAMRAALGVKEIPLVHGRLKRECLSKKAYSSSASANRAVKKINGDRPGQTIRIYVCSYCDSYHLTHKSLSA